MNDTASIVNGTDYQRSVLKGICRLKNLPALLVPKPSSMKPIQLHYRDSVFEGFATVLFFIETKYPVPEILIGEPETKAHLLMLALAIANPTGPPSNALDQLTEATETAENYLLGNIISLADMLILPGIENLRNSRYKRTLYGATKQWNESSSLCSPRR